MHELLRELHRLFVPLIRDCTARRGRIQQMNESDQQWTDEDFQSPPERSLADLTASLRERVARAFSSSLLRLVW